MPALVRTLLLALVAPALVAMRPAPVMAINPWLPDFEPEVFDETLDCLALNVYHEARSEPEKGQVAVAAVILNRVKSGLFPDSVCRVVKQGGDRRHNCQFSWWCDGKKDSPTEEEAWEDARRVAWKTLMGLSEDPTHGALYYHATRVKPSWAQSFTRTARIGHHVFYKPVQSREMRLSELR